MHALKPGFMRRHAPGTALASPPGQRRLLGQANVTDTEREGISIKIAQAAMSIMSVIGDLQFQRAKVEDPANLGSIPILGPFLSKGEMLTAFVQTAGQLGGVASRLEQVGGVYVTSEDRAILQGVHDTIRNFSGSISAAEQAPIAPENDLWVAEYIDFYTGEPNAAVDNISRQIVAAEASTAPELPDEPGPSDMGVLLGLGTATGIGLGLWWLTDFLGL